MLRRVRRPALAALLLLLAPTAALALVSSSAFILEPNLNNQALGTDVHVAGDVNADGYSDLLVSGTGGSLNHGFFALYRGGPGNPWSTQFMRKDFLVVAPSVAGAGDVNGDGRGDVVVGFGTTFRCYYGSAASTGIDTASFFQAIDPTFVGGTLRVGTAGDVNGDGYDDVVLGYSAYDGPAGPCAGTDVGIVRVYYGSASGLSAGSTWSQCGGPIGNFAELGYSVGTAGDVNGDGYDDVLVGSPGAFTNGRAFVFFGSASGLSSASGAAASGLQANERFGYSVSTAGDVNGDGYADFVVGAPNRDSPGGTVDVGAADVFLGGSGTIGASPSWTEYGAFGFSGFGISVSTAGDLNGDGRADVAVGEPSWTPTPGSPQFEGRVAVFPGTASGLSHTATYLTTTLASARLGMVVHPGGDADADGFGDLLVGSPLRSNPESGEGAAHLYRGEADPLTSDTVQNYFGSAAGAAFGSTVSAIGDFDADGFDDFVVAAPSLDTPHTDEGAIYMVRGTSTGPAPFANSTYQPGGTARVGAAVAGIGDFDGDGYGDIAFGAPDWASGAGFTSLCFGNGGADFWARPHQPLTNALPGQSHGAAVCGGDVNGDGYADVISGAPLYDGGAGTDQGRVYVFFGRPGPYSLPWAASQTLEAVQAGEHFGAALASLGDVNRDGYGDVAISSPNWDVPVGCCFFLPDAGRVRVYLGGPGGLSTSPQLVLDGSASFQQFGFSIAGIGDCQGDGYGDLAVGNPFVGNGSVNIYGGTPSGVTSAFTTVTGPQSGAQFGYAISTAADLNLDGFSELMVGAPMYDGSFGTDEGRIFVYLGSPSGYGTPPWWLKEGGLGGAHLGKSVSGGTDINGDGFGDVLAGAPDYSGGLSGQGYSQVYLGSRGTGVQRKVLQYSSNGLIMPPLSRSASESQFRLAGLSRSAAGRQKVAMSYARLASNGSGIWSGGSTGWFDVGAPSGGGAINLILDVSFLQPNTPYAWRSYVKSRSLYFPRTPWYYLQQNGYLMADFRTGPQQTDAPLPGAPVAGIELSAPFPNPASGRTRVEFALPRPGRANLVAYDLGGRAVRTLVDGEQPAGRRVVEWDGRGADGAAVSAGVYFLRLEAMGEKRTTRAVRVR